MIYLLKKQNVIKKRSYVYICTFYNKNTTVFAREIRQLLNAGYTIKNRYTVCPPTFLYRYCC